MTGQMASEGTSRGRQRPSHHLKACLRGFQMVYRAHILCEELKLKIVATSKNFEAVRPLFQSEAAWGHSSDLKPPRPPVYDTQMPCPDLRMSNLTLASVLNFWGRSRPPEAIWGRGQIQHPEYHIWGSRRFEFQDDVAILNFGGTIIRIMGDAKALVTCDKVALAPLVNFIGTHFFQLLATNQIFMFSLQTNWTSSSISWIFVIRFALILNFVAVIWSSMSPKLRGMVFAFFLILLLMLHF